MRRALRSGAVAVSRLPAKGSLLLAVTIQDSDLFDAGERDGLQAIR
jgi:hypothetical protein